MSALEIWEMASYVVTVFGLPLAIWVFLLEQRRERDNDEAETYQILSDAYADFLKLVMANPDLKLLSQESTPNISDEQRERMVILFEILVALFERAYLLVYDQKMTPKQLRRWHSWEDYMREWCRRDDFCEALPRLLQGEDEDFANHIIRLAQREGRWINAAVTTAA